eukprot:3518131-Prymnesium_polylepis.2
MLQSKPTIPLAGSASSNASSSPLHAFEASLPLEHDRLEGGVEVHCRDCDADTDTCLWAGGGSGALGGGWKACLFFSDMPSHLRIALPALV